MKLEFYNISKDTLLWKLKFRGWEDFVGASFLLDTFMFAVSNFNLTANDREQYLNIFPSYWHRKYVFTWLVNLHNRLVNIEKMNFVDKFAYWLTEHQKQKQNMWKSFLMSLILYKPSFYWPFQLLNEINSINWNIDNVSYRFYRQTTSLLLSGVIVCIKRFSL